LVGHRELNTVSKFLFDVIVTKLAKALVFVCFVCGISFAASVAFGQDCEPLKPVRPIDTELKNATEVQANALLKFLGSGSIKNEFEKIEKNSLRDLPNADRVHQWDSFVYMLCTLLRSSKSISESEKLNMYFKLLEEYRGGPPDANGKASSLFVRVEVSDLRGTTAAGTVYKIFSKSLPIEGLSVEAIVIPMVDAITLHLRAITSNPSYSVLVERSDDGLRIQRGNSGSASLFFSRFINVQTLAQLDDGLAGPIASNPVANNPSQRVLTQSPPVISVDPVSSFAAAGVYRMAVIAPGYNEVDKFLQLTKQGDLLTLANDSPPLGSGKIKIVEPTNPWMIELTRRSNSNMKIAVHPVHLNQGPATDTTNLEVTNDFQPAFLHELIVRGLDAFLVTPGMRLQWDPAQKKGLMTDGIVYSDIQMRVDLHVVRNLGL
jgi:hypothetical protein